MKKTPPTRVREKRVKKISEREYLGARIHNILNRALDRRLSRREYTQLMLLIAGVFDLPTQVQRKRGKGTV